MWRPVSVIVFLGIFLGCDAAPFFNRSETNLITLALQNVPEDYSIFTIIGRRLYCYETDPSLASSLTLKLEDGTEYLRLVSPPRRNYGDFYVKNANSIDYELVVSGENQQNNKKIQVTCTNTNGEVAKYDGSLVIGDVNDNEPVFERTNITYQTTIDEVLTVPVPLVIHPPANMEGAIIVADADGVDNNIVTAECVSMDVGNEKMPCDGFFSVTSSRYEKDGRYLFTVNATRQNYTGYESFNLVIRAKNVPNDPTQEIKISITQNVLINILDVQNSPPSIDKNALFFEMLEDLEPGSEVDPNKRIGAFDQDVRNPNAIRFQLLPFAGDPFAYDTEKFSLGVVYEDDSYYRAPLLLKNSIDREAIDSPTKTIYIDVKAMEYDPLNRTNRNPMTAEATVAIRILDVNDQIPTFGQNSYNIVIPELQPTANPKNFYQISNNINIVVNDDDSGLYNSFTVAFVGGNSNDMFKLNKYAGSGEEAFVLHAREELLDFETQPNQFTVTLRATDTHRTEFTSEATINIIITDANDHPPTFSERVVVLSVREDDPVGTSIGQISATDADSGMFGQIVSYEVLDSTEFLISNTGVITLNQALDFETKKTYVFTVRARDGGDIGNQNEGTVLISVLVKNVIDQGPVFVNDKYFATLAEESTDLVPEIVIEARSQEDVQQTVEYFLESVNPNTIPMNTFRVDRRTGKVDVTQPVNYKDSNNGVIEVTLKATAGNLSTITTLIISITDLNNYAPRFIPSNIYNVGVRENATAGHVVIALSVEDDDGPDTLNGQVSFQIVNGANDDFLIKPDTGVIIVTGSAKLSIEDKQATYELTIRAQDKGNPGRSALATVFIELIDSNNRDPIFEQPLYTFQINEGDPINTAIGTVKATDLDSDSLLNYAIDYNGAEFQRKATTLTEFIDASNIITIEPRTGLIKVAGYIDRQTYDRISFKVIAEDIAVDSNVQPIQTATASVVIFIQASIDPRIYFWAPWTRDNPVITKTFSETKSQNIQIMSLTATDPVIPETVTTYRKIASSDPEDYFYVSERVLYAKKALDYEAIPGTYVKKISCVVEAISRDQERTTTATIEVIVQDLNDNAPEFERSSYSFRVPEDKTYTYKVGTVKATDKDSASYGQVEYFLAGSNSEDFDIYPENTGRESGAVIFVSATAELDFETLNVYSLLLYAVDNPGRTDNVRFSSSVPVEIIIEDRNDMSPIFEEEIYDFTIIGTQAVQGDVGYIQAIDGDANRNGDITYSIFNSTNEGSYFFAIETQNQTSANIGQFLKIGRIFVRSSLENLPDRSLFELTVYGRDSGSPSRFGKCLVRITVSKGVQDLKPKWDERMSSRVTIEERRPVNTLVTKVTAYPSDAASTIKYSFVGAGDSFRDYESFNINPDTGAITTAVVLDHEAKRTYNLLILATDSLNSTLTNQFLLTVQVIDLNDNVPSFKDCEDISYNIPETATVHEEQSAGVFVFQARACDLDQAPHNRVKYSWFRDQEYCVAQNLQHFNLDEQTGVITTKVRLDRERIPEYLLCVEAFQDTSNRVKRDMISDLNDQENHDTVLYVLVTVLDMNDLGPKFLKPSVKKVILKYPAADVSVAEAYDDDLPPNNDIRYSIDSIKFIFDGLTQNAPTAFTVNGKDGTISVGTNDYSDYVGGYFDITIRADDYNGENVTGDTQLQRVYVTDQASRIRVVINRPADEGVDNDAKDMIERLNALDDDLYYEIKTISYHVTSDDEDPRFDKTDVCMVVVRGNSVLSSVSASKQLNDITKVKNILEDYGAVDPGPCDPAASVYPTGWESYWWVLVAFAIFIFVCCLILIFMICVLYRQYKQYMESRQTYLVPGN